MKKIKYEAYNKKYKNPRFIKYIMLTPLEAKRFRKNYSNVLLVKYTKLTIKGTLYHPSSKA